MRLTSSFLFVALLGCTGSIDQPEPDESPTTFQRAIVSTDASGQPVVMLEDVTAAQQAYEEVLREAAANGDEAMLRSAIGVSPCVYGVTFYDHERYMGNELCISNAPGQYYDLYSLTRGLWWLGYNWGRHVQSYSSWLAHGCIGPLGYPFINYASGQPCSGGEPYFPNTSNPVMFYEALPFEEVATQ
jgi:hypothetical protein